MTQAHIQALLVEVQHLKKDLERFKQQVIYWGKEIKSFSDQTISEI